MRLQMRWRENSLVAKIRGNGQRPTQSSDELRSLSKMCCRHDSYSSKRREDSAVRFVVQKRDVTAVMKIHTLSEQHAQRALMVKEELQ